MYCYKCGSVLAENSGFCTLCGAENVSASGEDTRTNTGNIGYSPRISDPAFKKYIKNSNRWSGVFAAGLAVAAIVGFYIYGQTSPQMDNPQALYIGLGIGAMFLLIALFQIISRKRSRTWDAVVVDKTIEKKRRKKNSGTDGFYYQNYTEFAVVIRDQAGKKHRLTAENDDTVYNYYKVGDHVRHHAGLNSFEKYDKSNDNIIFCSACASLCDISDDVCFRCNCPLLK